MLWPLVRLVEGIPWQEEQMRYRGSEQWYADVESAKAKWVVKREEAMIVYDGPKVYGTVRYTEAEAGTGSRYAVCVTPLPPGANEGGPVLVTVIQPWQDCWALQPTGFLAQSYVEEHLSAGRYLDDRLHGGDMAALLLTVAHALGREPGWLA
jgi:hypothetical protein